MNFLTRFLFSQRTEGDARLLRYRHAAVAYLIYGIIYMMGAGHLGMTGATSRASESNAWVWYLFGALLVVLFPWLVSRGFMWFTRALALMVCFRIYGLLTVAAGPTAAQELELIGDLTISKSIGAITFAAVALVTVVFLARASFQSGERPSAADGLKETAS